MGSKKRRLRKTLHGALSYLAARRMEAPTFGKTKLMRRGIRNGKKGDFVRCHYTELLSAPVMSEAPGLAEGKLQCSIFKVKNSEMEE
ncbi:hypothetical protein J1N35_035414 [Gossypium stocksii]|uniref:Uncharacterized protein n=1 Tax=Gossypium stocksii TaxID=47602 RepID=A0A9D3UVN6_9ROSI|nr:hypothetical protein J1N35_035414 [Gossypium stocksii]